MRILSKYQKIIFTSMILVLCFGAFVNCKKRMFKKIRVTGVTNDWFTGAPVPSTVRIWSDNSQKEERLKIKDFDVNTDGTFDKEFRAGRTGRYYVLFTGDNLHSENHRLVDIDDGSTFDFGKIEFEHRFFCSVALKHTSSRDVRLTFDGDRRSVSYGPGTDARYIDQLNLTQDEFSQNRSYSLSYTIMGPSIFERSIVIVPFTNSDTVSASVEF